MSERLYLSDSRVHLNNPGTQVSDIYYAKNNCIVDASEVTYNTGRFIQSLTNKTFSGTGVVNIQNQALWSTAYLQVQLPDLVANQTLGRGWLFSLINRLSFTFGGANVGQISISGQSLFQIIMTQCETEEKASQMLKLAGEEQLAAGAVREATIILPLPFSSAAGLHPKKPYDSTLLGSPLTVGITFNPASSIYGGSGAEPTEMVSARLLLRQGEFSNSGHSLRSILRSQPDMRYGYPILHHQSLSLNFTSGVVTGGKSEGIFQLQSFINADLVSLMVGIVKQSEIRKSPTNDSPNPLNYQRIRDVVLEHNGAILYNAPGSSHQLMQLTQGPGASYFQGSVISAGAVNPFFSNPVDTNILLVDFSRLKQEVFDAHFANTFRIAEQTVTISLNLDAEDTYIAYVTYVYNGMIDTLSAGQSQIYYN